MLGLAVGALSVSLLFCVCVFWGAWVSRLVFFGLRNGGPWAESPGRLPWRWPGATDPLPRGMKRGTRGLCFPSAKKGTGGFRTAVLGAVVPCPRIQSTPFRNTQPRSAQQLHSSIDRVDERALARGCVSILVGSLCVCAAMVSERALASGLNDARLACYCTGTGHS